MNEIKKSIVALALASTAICGLLGIGSNFNKTEESISQVSADDYYQKVVTTSREGMYNSLSSIISSGYVEISYSGLWDAYKTTDLRSDGKIWDMYSNTNYDPDRDRAGNYQSEGDVFNREHSVPKSWFNEQKPAYSDLFHLYPTDGYVNGKRSNYPFGVVKTATYTSRNGCKLGTSDSTTGISGTVFEPADEYKGDFARTYFYFATRYTSFAKNMSGDGAKVFSSSFPYLNSRFIDLYYKWHKNDPVSDKEINRNDAVYTFQHNRNPYIDHPEWADYIFKGADPTPITGKVLERIAISGNATTNTYVEGQTFNKSGLTVTAYFDEDGVKTSENVTDKVTVSPATLSVGTTSVTLSYNDGTTTKSAVYSGITVTEAPVNYGTIDNPLSVAEARALIDKQCSSYSYTKQPIYCIGRAGSFISTDASAYTQKFYINDLDDASSVCVVDSLSMTADQFSKFRSDDNIIFHGYGYKNNATLQFKTNGSNKVILDRNLSKEGNIPVKSVTIQNDVVDFMVGDTCTIVTNVEPDFATDKSLTYISSDSSIAEVNSSGLVSFKKGGSVTITVKSVNNISDSITFAIEEEPTPVPPTPPTPVVVDIQSIEVPNKIEMLLDETKQVQYKVLPANATDKDVSWSSSDTQVVKVSNSGVLTAMNYGSAVVTVKSADGKVAATITVSVPEDKKFDDEVAELFVEKYPTTTIYNVGDSFNKKGLVVVAHLVSGGKIDVTSKSKIIAPELNEAGTKTVNITYKTKYSVSFNVHVINNAITGINIEKNPLKTHYFASESFNPRGLVVKATFAQGDPIDVTNSVNFDYDFSVDNKVKVCLDSFEKEIEVVIESGEVTVEHRAADFTYNFSDELGAVKTEDVTLNKWKSMEYYFNQLDSDAKEALKNTAAASKNEVNAAEDLSSALKDCVTRYDEIYLAHKAEGFNDFMNRKPVDTKSGQNQLLILIAVCAGIVVLTILIIVICVSASKHKKRKALAK